MAQKITVCYENFGCWLGTGYPGNGTGTRVRVYKRVPGYTRSKPYEGTDAELFIHDIISTDLLFGKISLKTKRIK
jgi:hypothetical protein